MLLEGTGSDRAREAGFVAMSLRGTRSEQTIAAPLLAAALGPAVLVHGVFVEGMGAVLFIGILWTPAWRFTVSPAIRSPLESGCANPDTGRVCRQHPARAASARSGSDFEPDSRQA